MLQLLVCALLAAPLPAPPQGPPQVVVLEAVADATLVEHPLGAIANGSGPYFFAGRNNQPVDALRRAVLRFDVAAALPHNAIVLDARLVLHLSQGDPLPVEMRLHRVLRSWTEGPSTASGGQGAPALPGDVTWIHRSAPGLHWNRPGGDFLPVVSAATVVTGPGVYVWDTPRLVRDVRLMLRNPGRNAGWILVGDESIPGSARRFDAREFTDPARRPALELRYTVPGPP